MTDPNGMLRLNRNESKGDLIVIAPDLLESLLHHLEGAIRFP